MTHERDRARWLRYVLVGDGCWLWTGATDTAGYGRFYFRREVRPAHRIGYELFVEPIPADLMACHECDNPPCVRFGHVFPGTPRDNAADMLAKGRGNFSKRLTLAIAQEMRQIAREERPSLAVLATSYGVTKSTVSDVLLGLTWPDGSDPIHIDGTGTRHPRSKLTRDAIAEIRLARAGGATFVELARRHGVSKPTARAAALGLSYRGEAI